MFVKKLFKRKPKKVGLALGSGAARGWAHIGFLKALKEAGIRVDCLAGTSIGAFVGAFWAAGKIEVLERSALEIDRKTMLGFIDLTFPKSGMIEGEKITEFLSEHLGNINIENLSIPFAAIATDIVTGKEVVIKEGPLIEAVRASIAIPGIFTPVKSRGSFLVDGGVLNPLPVNAAKNLGADVVIAVDLNAATVTPAQKRLIKESEKGFGLTLKEKVKALPYLKNWLSDEPRPHIFDVILTSIYLMEQEITRYKLTLCPADVVIRPQVGDIGTLDFYKAALAIAEGYRIGMAHIEKIKNLI